MSKKQLAAAALAGNRSSCYSVACCAGHLLLLLLHKASLLVLTEHGLQESESMLLNRPRITQGTIDRLNIS